MNLNAPPSPISLLSRLKPFLYVGFIAFLSGALVTYYIFSRKKGQQQQQPLPAEARPPPPPQPTRPVYEQQRPSPYPYGTRPAQYPPNLPPPRPRVPAAEPGNAGSGPGRVIPQDVYHPPAQVPHGAPKGNADDDDFDSMFETDKELNQVKEYPRGVE